jgi:hypothetical protein
LSDRFCVDVEEVLPRLLWAELVRYRAGWCCEDCGKTFVPNAIGQVRQYGQRLAAHHLNHDGTDHRLSNGRALCSSCHRVHHPGGGTTEAARRGWITRRARGTINSRFARMTAEEHSAKARKGAASRQAEPERDVKGRFA